MELIDICPECGFEVFELFNITRKWKCVEPECDWTGDDPIVRQRKDYE